MKLVPIKAVGVKKERKRKEPVKGKEVTRRRGPVERGLQVEVHLSSSPSFFWRINFD